MSRSTLRCLLLLVACAATSAIAAVPEGPPPTLASAWTLSPWTLLPLFVLAALYVRGLTRLWRRAGIGRGVSRGEAGAFAAGVLTLLLAMVWPLDAFAAYALSAHVAQHMTLLALAPPLLLAGRPWSLVASALPRRWSARLHRSLHRPLSALATALAPAAVVHGATMWLWHLPGATSAALADTALHRAMHASFLIAGIWFWAAVWRRLRAPDAGAVGGLVALVAVMMQMGFLGALLTFAPRLLYPVYTDRALLIGLDPLRDQQLAGLLMWVPSGVPYIVVGLWLVVALLRRMRHRG
ncbi:cytochrome c oxidase assembly protein [Luteimonas sp. S4-F44]|uniref:cytochrome c oxidase assembly protein n=1 Tax=Luteimonas sp. S4-F44 TaxID=2925842 RepID=UPI001F53CA0F|nr:cytochrome c oxidase assembly protein [Luteimonas sp. S4-F44]UNK42743.1 cytochrome c oxidase assembly protein [Luteimonas sp. S4-F44]